MKNENILAIKIFRFRKSASDKNLRKIQISSSEAIFSELTEQEITALMQQLNQSAENFHLVRWQLRKKPQPTLIMYIKELSTEKLLQQKSLIYEYFTTWLYFRQQEKNYQHIDKLERKRAELAVQNLQLESNFNQIALSEEQFTSEQKKITKEKDQSQQEIRQLESEITGLNTKNGELEEKNSKLNAKVEQLIADRSVLQDKLHLLVTQQKENSASYDAIRLANSQLTKSIDDLTLKNQELLHENNLLKDPELADKIQAFKAEKQQALDEKQQLAEELQQVRAEKTQFQKQVEAMQLENNELTEKQQRNTEVHQQLTAEKDELAERVHSLETELKTLGIKNQQLENKLSSVAQYQEIPQPDVLTETIEEEAPKKLPQTGMQTESIPVESLNQTKTLTYTAEVESLKNKFALAEDADDKIKRKINARQLRDGILKIGYCSYYWDIIDLNRNVHVDSQTHEILKNWIDEAPQLEEELTTIANQFNYVTNNSGKISSKKLAYLDAYHSLYQFLSTFYML